jgi:UPF0716 protein FxsA
LTRLFLLFTTVTALELFLLLQLGSIMGALETFLLIVFTGFVGASMTRREGLAVLRQIALGAQRGVPPTKQLAEGALIVAGGLLLVTPGVLTDLVGFSLVFPTTRQALAPILLRRLGSMVTVHGMRVDLGSSPESPERPGPATSSPFDHPAT